MATQRRCLRKRCVLQSVSPHVACLATPAATPQRLVPQGFAGPIAESLPGAAQGRGDPSKAGGASWDDSDPHAAGELGVRVSGQDAGGAWPSAPTPKWGVAAQQGTRAARQPTVAEEAARYTAPSIPEAMAYRRAVHASEVVMERKETGAAGARPGAGAGAGAGAMVAVAVEPRRATRAALTAAHGPGAALYLASLGLLVGALTAMWAPSLFWLLALNLGSYTGEGGLPRIDRYYKCVPPSQPPSSPILVPSLSISIPSSPSSTPRRDGCGRQ